MRRRTACGFRFDRLAILWLGATATAGLGGCYDGREMVDRVLQRIADDHLAEVDLGTYQITLPRSDDDPLVTSIRLEIVGAVERRNARAVTRELAEVETSLRHATILALRQSERSELLEPDLKALRHRIMTVTAEHIREAPIRSIAFRSFSVYED
jgi:hypothetical protein